MSTEQVKRKCACGNAYGIIRKERVLMGHTLPEEPMCWNCWDKTKRPDWRDELVTAMIKKCGGCKHERLAAD